MLNNLKKNKIFKSYEFMLVCVILILFIIFSIASKGRFCQIKNIKNMFVSNAVNGIIAFGSLFVIISGGIDISFMAIGAVAQYVAAFYMLYFGGNFIIVFAIAMIVGIILGFGNAILVNKTKIPTLIITIATMNIIYGVVMRLITIKPEYMRLEKLKIVAEDGTKKLIYFPDWFSKKTNVSLFLMTIGVLIVVLVVSWFILNKTKIGRKIYAIGGNLEAAKRCGIDILKVHLFVYGFAGAMAGVGALVKCYGSQQANISNLYGKEMDVIAMVVLGGVSLSGGKGSVFGTTLGIILIAMLRSGMIFVGITSYWENLVIGAVILISFCITGWRRITFLINQKKGGKIDVK